MKLKERINKMLPRERIARSLVIFIMILSLALLCFWGLWGLGAVYQHASRWIHENPQPVAQTNKPEANGEKPTPVMEQHPSSKTKVSTKTFARAVPHPLPQPSPLPGSYPAKKVIIEEPIAPVVTDRPGAVTSNASPREIYFPKSGTQGSLETKIYRARWKTPAIVQIEGTVINHDDTRQKLITQDSTAVDDQGNPVFIASGFGQFKFGTCNHDGGGEVTQLDPGIPVAFCVQIADPDPYVSEMNLALYFYWERAPASYTFASIPIQHQ
jgi:hypothetical protein